MEKGLKVLSKRKKVLGDKVGEVELLALKFKKTELIKLRYNKVSLNRNLVSKKKEGREG